MASATCPHVSTSVGLLSRKDLQQLISVPQCDVCQNSAPNLWLCLYPDCYMLGCGDDDDDAVEANHSTEHNRRFPAHAIQLNIRSHRSWCYSCSHEVLLGQHAPLEIAPLSPVLKREANDTEPLLASSITAMSDANHERKSRKRPVGGLVGLLNLGNTCYMNSALQCLSNVPPLTEFFLRCPAIVEHCRDRPGRDSVINLSKAYRQLVLDMWKNGRKSEGRYLAPSTVSFAFKMSHPIFKGCHQHDSQEFLRCFLDHIHEELKESMLDVFKDGNEEDLESVSESESTEGRRSYQSEEAEQEYETADSGVSEQSSSGNGDSDVAGMKRKRNRVECNAKRQDLDNEGHLSASDVEQDFMDASSSRPGSPQAPVARNSRSPISLSSMFAKLPIAGLQKHKPKAYRSVISDIFDGKLVSSVHCLSCDQVSMTTETFQDLSLPIPNQEPSTALRNQTAAAPPNSVDSGWMSWIFSWLYSFVYGPTITLQDCLAYFFSEDELKGDNMYSCEKCKKLRNGVKFSRVTVLPDTLCIHLKRFRHEFAFSSKISTKVTFPHVDMDMSPWLHPSDTLSKETMYDLIGLICHQGTAGGGHYIAYALNPVNQNWYQFDDSTVTPVEAAHVLSVEAYVLFYRKKSHRIEPLRTELHRRLHEAQSQVSHIKFYVSLQWINKFEHCAEPGPIDNSDFLCSHGGMLPHKVDYINQLCIAFPKSVWELLHSRFGGGPVCNHLHTCSQCEAEADALNRQKKFQLEEFRRLLQESKDGDSQVPMNCVSSVWFKQWEEFVLGRQLEPPGPIDNRGIITTSLSRTTTGAPVQSLRHSSKFVPISPSIWQLFHSIYGGGPMVILRPNGTSTVISCRHPSLMALSSKLPARSLAEMTSGVISASASVPVLCSTASSGMT